MKMAAFTSDEVERYAQFVAGHPDAEIDPRHRAAVRAVLGGLATDGRLLPPGGKVTEQYACRTSSDLQGTQVTAPGTRGAATTWVRYWRNMSSTRKTYPFRVELVRREIRTWPGGMTLTGAWEPVDEEEGR